MLSLALLVALSPTLIFDGLTVSKLISWFNVHPFWCVFFIALWLRSSTLNLNVKSNDK